MAPYTLHIPLQLFSVSLCLSIKNIYVHGRIQRGGGGPGVRTPPGILAKMCLSDSWNGTGLILHSIYVKYSHKLKKKGSKCGDILMVRTGNVDFSCKRLTSIEIRKSKYHIIRRVRFRWDPPPPLRKISGSALDVYITTASLLIFLYWSLSLSDCSYLLSELDDDQYPSVPS